MSGDGLMRLVLRVVGVLGDGGLGGPPRAPQEVRLIFHGPRPIVGLGEAEGFDALPHLERDVERGEVRLQIIFL